MSLATYTVISFFKFLKYGTIGILMSLIYLAGSAALMKIFSWELQFSIAVINFAAGILLYAVSYICFYFNTVRKYLQIEASPYFKANMATAELNYHNFTGVYTEKGTRLFVLNSFFDSDENEVAIFFVITILAPIISIMFLISYCSDKTEFKRYRNLRGLFDVLKNTRFTSQDVNLMRLYILMFGKNLNWSIENRKSMLAVYTYSLEHIVPPSFLDETLSHIVLVNTDIKELGRRLSELEESA